MPPDAARRDDEPSQPGDSGRGGSLVVGLDPSAREGVHAAVAADIRTLFGIPTAFLVPYDPRYAAPVRDAMRWTPPPDGEETPPCPA